MSETNRKRRGRGEGGVRFDEKRKLWVASVSLGYHADGRRNRPVGYGKTKREALDELDRIRRENASGPPSEAAKLTVGELLGLWLESGRGLAEHTQEQRAGASEQVRADLGARTASRLTPLDVSCWHAAMNKAGLSPSAAWHAARALTGCLSHAVKLQALPSNPAAAVKLPAMPEREMVVLSEQQGRALLAASQGYVAWPLVAVALGSGIRQGEQLGLFPADVSLDAATLAVRRALVRTKTSGFVLKRAKTKAARRTLALPPFAVEALRQVIEAGGPWPEGRTIFCGPSGAHRHRGRLTSHLKKAIVRANRAGAAIPLTFRWHDLRHTHASLLLSAGHSIRAVSARLGHASPAFTLKIYAHLLPGDDERLAVGIQGILG